MLLVADLGVRVVKGQEQKAKAPADAQELYDTTRVWTVHLSFAPDQWAALEPKRSPNARGPFGRGPDEAHNAARAAELFTPIVMSQADGDRNGKLSAKELTASGHRWFRAWDKDGDDKVSEAELNAGLETLPNPLGGGGLTLVGEAGKRNGIASVLGIEFDYVHAHLEFEGQRLKDVAVRIKGNGTFLELGDNRKRALKIDLNKYREGQKLGGVTTLNLQNNITDASWMNEVLAYRLFRDAGVPAPRTAYARAYVTVPGTYDREYFGLYSLSENVDEQFVESRFGTAKHGAIYKPVTPLLFADFGADWAVYQQRYDPKTKLTDVQKKAVTDLCRLVTQADDLEFSAQIGEFIDLPELARYLAVLVYLSDLDGILGPGQNLYLYWRPETRRFVFIPWDQDRSWGQFERASQEQRDQLSIHHPWQGDKPFFDRLFKVEAFKQPYLQNLAELSTSLFQPERIAKQVDEIAAAIRPEVDREPTPSLDRFDLAVTGKSLPPVRRGGFGGGGETQPIKPFAHVRLRSIRSQLAGQSEGLRLDSGWPAGSFGRGGNPSELVSLLGAPLHRLLADAGQPAVTEGELVRGLEQLFQTWDVQKTGDLDYAQLQAGMEKSLSR